MAPLSVLCIFPPHRQRFSFLGFNGTPRLVAATLKVYERWKNVTLSFHVTFVIAANVFSELHSYGNMERLDGVGREFLFPTISFLHNCVSRS